MAALKRALLCLLASAACARSPPSTSAAGGFGRSLEEGVACVDPSLGGVAPSLGSTAISEAGDRSTAQGRHGFAVKRDAWADATVGVLDDDLYFEGVAHGNLPSRQRSQRPLLPCCFGRRVDGAPRGRGGVGARGGARARSVGAAHLLRGPQGLRQSAPPGSRLEAEALAAAGLDAAELASARQAEAEALTREAVRMAEAEAAEETPAHELAEAEAAERFAAGFAATTPSPREEEEEAHRRRIGRPSWRPRAPRRRRPRARRALQRAAAARMRRTRRHRRGATTSSPPRLPQRPTTHRPATGERRRQRWPVERWERAGCGESVLRRRRAFDAAGADRDAESGGEEGG